MYCKNILNHKKEPRLFSRRINLYNHILLKNPKRDLE